VVPALFLRKEMKDRIHRFIHKSFSKWLGQFPISTLLAPLTFHKNKSAEDLFTYFAVTSAPCLRRIEAHCDDSLTAAVRKRIKKELSEAV